MGTTESTRLRVLRKKMGRVIVRHHHRPRIVHHAPSVVHVGRPRPSIVVHNPPVVSAPIMAPIGAGPAVVTTRRRGGVAVIITIVALLVVGLIIVAACGGFRFRNRSYVGGDVIIDTGSPYYYDSYDVYTPGYTTYQPGYTNETHYYTPGHG